MMHMHISKLLAGVSSPGGIFSVIVNQLGQTLHWNRNNDTAQGIETKKEKMREHPKLKHQSDSDRLGMTEPKIYDDICSLRVFLFFTFRAATCTSSSKNLCECYHFRNLDIDYRRGSRSCRSTSLRFLPRSTQV